MRDLGIGMTSLKKDTCVIIFKLHFISSAKDVREVQGNFDFLSFNKCV